MKKMNKKGFTIVELVIVIAVIAILAAVLIPTYTSVVNKANASARLQKARNAYTEYIAAHPTKEIDYISFEDSDKTVYYYEIANEFKETTTKPSDKVVLTVNTCLDEKGTEENAAETCPDCGWKLTVKTADE